MGFPGRRFVSRFTGESSCKGAMEQREKLNLMQLQPRPQLVLPDCGVGGLFRVVWDQGEGTGLLHPRQGGRLPLEMGCNFAWSNSFLPKAIPREQWNCESSSLMILATGGRSVSVWKRGCTPQRPLHQRRTRRGKKAERDSGVVIMTKVRL